MNVLVVDDTAMIRVIVRRNLIALGVREDNIFLAKDGEDGLALFTTFHCRGIITDLRMPVMDGLTFVEEIRKRDAQVPIIMLTSANGREDFQAAIESGVNDYLIKPFTSADIKIKLRKMLSRMKEKPLASCGE
jgi:two-component system chemotaxis response regulator CheY